MRVIVCGGRDFADHEWLFAELDRLRAELGITHVVTGSQRRWDKDRRQWLGLDYWAEQWARSRCLWYSGLPANWDAGNGAGPTRNGRMLREARPGRVIAGPGYNGTANMKDQARAAGVEVIELTPSTTS